MACPEILESPPSYVKFMFYLHMPSLEIMENTPYDMENLCYFYRG